MSSLIIKLIFLLFFQTKRLPGPSLPFFATSIKTLLRLLKTLQMKHSSTVHNEILVNPCLKPFFSIGEEFEWMRQKRLAGTSGEKAENSLC
jgi:hypothetical protein